MASIGSPRQAPALAAICAADFVVLGALAVPITVGLARHVSHIRPADASWSPEQGVSMAFVAAALVSLASQILFGWLGDRVRTRRHGRLPFMVAGGVLGAACLWQVGHAPSLAGVIGWFALGVLGYGASLASIFGTFADVIDGRTRSWSAGWLAAAAGAATGVPLAVHSVLPVSAVTSFGLFPVLACVVLAGSAVVLHPYVDAAGRTSEAIDSGPAPDELPGWRSQFWLLVLQRGLAQLAIVFGAIYPFLFLVRRVGLDAGADSTSHWATGVAAGGDALGVIAAVGFGYVAARRMDSLRPMRLGLVLMATGLLAMAFATSTWHYLVAQLVIGFGSGAYLGCDLGLVFRVVPARTAGRYLGYFNIARNLPQTIGPVIGPVLLAVGSGDRLGVDRSQNYTMFFLAGTIVALLALAAMSGLRVRSADSTPRLEVPVAP